MLVIWFACGLLAAIIAASKGRNFFGWLILGLLFGIFALIAAAFMPAVSADRRGNVATLILGDNKKLGLVSCGILALIILALYQPV